MKIHFLITQDLESPAGVGRYFPLARCLVDLGSEVKITALHPDFAKLTRRRYTQDGVTIAYVSQMHVLKRNDQKVYFPLPQLILNVLKATWRLGIEAIRTPADIVHIGKPHPMNSLAGLIVKYLQRRIVFLDYDDYEAVSGNFEKYWLRKIIQIFEDSVPKHVHQITTHTEFLHQRLLGLGVKEENIKYLPNGVDSCRFCSTSPQKVEQLRTALGLEGKRVAAFIGSLSFPSHPVHLLIEAFQYIISDSPETKLLLVGGGDQIDNLKEMVNRLGLEDSVVFTGRISPEDIPIYYRLANVIVDPVDDDLIGRSRLPIKLFESWICEVPFVTGDVGDRKRVLGDPPAGVLAEPGDPISLSKCILRVFKEPGLSKMLIKRGKERAKLFTWEEHAAQLYKYYQQQLSS